MVGVTMRKHSLDRGKLSPLALEVVDARDGILRLLIGLRDDPKALMALSYAAASYLDHVSALTGHEPEVVLATFSGTVLRTVRDGVLTVDLADFGNGTNR
jgi:hypothetical protein